VAAPTRTTHKSIRQSLRGHNEIKHQLALLEKAANKQLRTAGPRLSYEPGELAEVFLDDLEKVVSPNDWRSPLERSVDRLSRASNRIRQAVSLLVQATNGCPKYAAVPLAVLRSTPETKGERLRTPTLSFEDLLKSEIERQRRSVIDLKTLAPEFLMAMMKYAARCQCEAERLKGILKARNRHFDRLGPLLQLMRDVESFTGKYDDRAVVLLLDCAYGASGSAKEFSIDAIRKIRRRHLTS